MESVANNMFTLREQMEVIPNQTLLNIMRVNLILTLMVAESGKMDGSNILHGSLEHVLLEHVKLGNSVRSIRNKS